MFSSDFVKGFVVVRKGTVKIVLQVHFFFKIELF